jgi:methionine-rich copper-binding protein CopC
MRRPIVAALAALTVLAAAIGPVWSHAFLARAAPAVGSTVPAAPAEIVLRFTEPVEPAFSVVTVTGTGGDRVDAGDLHADPADPTILRASLKPLAAGIYKVVWRVVSVDTHVTTGEFRFTVAP